MLRTKIIVGLVLLILASFSALATCHPNCPESPATPSAITFNPDNPTSFDYVNGDYSTISDWSKVEWSEIPANRIPEVPAEQLQYAQITGAQRLEMSVAQIAVNLERIDNLALDVNEERAREAIKKEKGVEVLSLGKSARMENNVLKVAFGEQGNFDFSGKEAGWIIEVNEEGVVLVIKPDQIKEESLSTADRFTLAAKTVFITTSGTTATVTGLSFEQGRSHVKTGETATVDVDNDGINDYSIPAQKNPVNIYLDPAVKTEGVDKWAGNGIYEGNYVAISKENLALGSVVGGTVQVIPQPGNALLGMLRREYGRDDQGMSFIASPQQMVPDERSKIALTIANGDGLMIQSRQAEGKTPLFQHDAQGGQLSIETGKVRATVVNGKLKVKPPPPLPKEVESSLPLIPNSVALELVSNAEGLAGATLRTSSSNRYSLLRGGKEVSGTNMDLTVSDQIDDNMMKTIDDLKVRYPTIHFKFRSEEEILLMGGNPTLVKIDRLSANMVQVVDQWLQQNAHRQSNIKSMGFDGRMNAAALRGEGTGTLILGERAFDPATLQARPIRNLNPLEIMDHEYDHLQVNLVKQEEEKLIAQGVLTPEQLKGKSLQEKYNLALQKAAESVLQSKEYKTLLDRLRLLSIKLNYLQGAVEGKATMGVVNKDLQKDFGLTIEPSDYLPYQANAISTAASHLNDIQNIMYKNRRASMGLVNLVSIGIGPDQVSEIDASLREAARAYPPLREEQQLVENLVKRTALLPPYSFRNYAKYPGDYDFSEVPSTYTEIPRDTVRTAITQGNEFVRTATQLAYDSGQIDEPEYQYRMGSYCSQNPPNCGKCIEYKLTCKP